MDQLPNLLLWKNSLKKLKIFEISNTEYDAYPDHALIMNTLQVNNSQDKLLSKTVVFIILIVQP